MSMRGDWIKLVGIFWLLVLTTLTLFPDKYPATLRLVLPVGGTIVQRGRFKLTFNQAEGEGGAEGECSKNCEVCEKLPIK